MTDGWRPSVPTSEELLGPAWDPSATYVVCLRTSVHDFLRLGYELRLEFSGPRGEPFSLMEARNATAA